MSTLSTKYVPHRLRPENIKQFDAQERQASLPTKNTRQGRETTSICLGELDRTIPCYDTTKGDDFDTVGMKLMETALDRHLQIQNEKSNSIARLQDLTGVHFEVGHDPFAPNLKSLAQASFTKTNPKLLVENKKKIVKADRAYEIGKASIAKDSDPNWKNYLKSNIMDHYCSPTEQMKKNVDNGKAAVPRSRPLVTKGNVFVANPDQPKDGTIYEVSHESNSESVRIINDMRTCHWMPDVIDPLSQDTEFRRHYGEKELTGLRCEWDKGPRNSSNVVMGTDDAQDKKERYNSTYKNTIHEATLHTNHTVETARQERQRKERVLASMRECSLELGTDVVPKLSSAQVDFKAVKYQ